MGSFSNYSYKSHTYLKMTTKHSGHIICVRYSRNNYTILMVIYKWPTLITKGH